MRQGKLMGMGRAVEGLLEEGHEKDEEEEGEGRVFPTELAGLGRLKGFLATLAL